LEASATERQLVLSWHSLRCANHPFYACALNSLQLSFKMGNKYVRKGAAAKVAPPSARGPAPKAALRQEDEQQQQQAATAEDPIEDPVANQRAALQEKQDELEAQE
jgi:hypothetical protein